MQFAVLTWATLLPVRSAPSISSSSDPRARPSQFWYVPTRISYPCQCGIGSEKVPRKRPEIGLWKC
eukprot:3146685-Rhodomonas_salina.1